MINITIPGRPVPAVRMTQRSKFVSVAAQRYLQYKETVGWHARSVCKNKIDGNVEAEIVFYLVRGNRGDIDNLQKAIFDGMNKIVYNDDRQVTRVAAEIKIVPSKTEQKTEVTIRKRREQR